MAMLDLRDAYLHIPIHPAYQIFFKTSSGDQRSIIFSSRTALRVVIGPTNLYKSPGGSVSPVKTEINYDQPLTGGTPRSGEVARETREGSPDCTRVSPVTRLASQQGEVFSDSCPESDISWA